MAGDKSSRPVLVYFAPNHLFCKVPDHIRCRRDSPERKLVDLTDKSLFLRISEEFMEKGGSGRSGGGSACMPAHQRCTLKFKIFCYSSIIRD